MICETNPARPVIDYSRRSTLTEMMDDEAIVGAPLEEALQELRFVNRFLGGYRALSLAVEPFLRTADPVRILDVGSGIGDYGVELARLARRRGVRLEVTLSDSNAATVEYGSGWLRKAGHVGMDGIEYIRADALALPFEDASFDLVISSMTLHHFEDDEAIRVLQEMKRVASRGVIINDLQRHRLAYLGILTISRLGPFSEMFRHDGPRSVLKGFTREDLGRLARSAGFRSFKISWRWAFRWVMVSEVP
jgi:ubiquinone/menaquinone biosynthesis C-methylase UbiE